MALHPDLGPGPAGARQSPRGRDDGRARSTGAAPAAGDGGGRARCGARGRQGTRTGRAGRVAGAGARVDPRAHPGACPSERPVRVLLVYGFDPLVVAGPGGFADELLSDAGALNVASDAASPYPVYSVEHALRSRPELILDADDRRRVGSAAGASRSARRRAGPRCPRQALLHPGPGARSRARAALRVSSTRRRADDDRGAEAAAVVPRGCASRRPAPALVLVGLLVLRLVALAASALLGEYPVHLVRALTEPASRTGECCSGCASHGRVLGAMVGASLAASGSALQSLLRNPLADPFVLGVSGGAALGATLALALGLQALAGPSLFAFVGRGGGDDAGAGGGARPELSLRRAAHRGGVQCLRRRGHHLHQDAAHARPAGRGAVLAGRKSRIRAAQDAARRWRAPARRARRAVGRVGAAEPPLARATTRPPRSACLSVAPAPSFSSPPRSASPGRWRSRGWWASWGSSCPTCSGCGSVRTSGSSSRRARSAGRRSWCSPMQATRMLFAVFHAEPPVGVVTAVLGGPLFVWLLSTGGSTPA